MSNSSNAPMGVPHRILRRDPDFLKLWVGQSVSLAGSQVTLLALPLTAAFALKASAGQMGLLEAAGQAPWLIVALVVGVWVDRARRRRFLIGADIGRAAILLSIPIAAMFGVLQLAHLYVVAFLAGVLTVVFGIASPSYIPSLVPREHLVEANSKLATSQSMAEIAGPGLAGILVQVLTAPLAIVLDALSYLISGSCLLLIRAHEPAPPAEERRHGIWREIYDGIRLVIEHPIQRASVATAATFNFFIYLMNAVYILYIIRQLHLSPAILGVIFAAGGAGGLIGSVLAARITRRHDVGPTIVGSALLYSSVHMLVPLASGPVPVAAGLLIAARFLDGLGGLIYDITLVSALQAMTPHQFLGRMNASARFILAGVIPLGSLAGGVLGQMIGLRPTLAVGACGTLVAFLWVLCSPVRTLRRLPESPREP